MQKICLIILACLFLSSCGDEKKEKDTVEKVEVIEKPIVEAYGFNLEDFVVLKDTVRNGDSFGDLMIKNKVDYQKIFKISTEFKDTFDVRKIKIGKPYAILKSKDTSEIAQYFIYEDDRINYTVVDLRDSVIAYHGKKNVKYVERVASGVINSNLSTAINEQGIDYMVTNNLSEIYAWSIDFFRLQKGDKFKVLYKEKYINDSIYAGAEPIEAAFFEHNGESFYAFSYETDSVNNISEYYNEQAKNLRRAFLKAPVEFSRISSRYNLNRRIAYYGYKVRPHKGTDYAAPIGTPILATANGTVIESTRRGGNGKYVKIEHNSTYSTQYLHMKNQNVKKGQYVKQGDVIGWIGMTGNTGGPHVCYRFWKNGKQVDPLREKLPVAEPIVDSLRGRYLEFISPIKAKLDSVPYIEVKIQEEVKEEQPLTLK
ncbi:MULTISPECIES: M23 family metallopeptidase [Cellulophaga]|jgi:murein DD-endopeptidase MepM/ murein hydrolase activator NlpD|uniref:Murein DD-endopeptidase MepM and murein hydrolase activator NlpD, contain LysM domain n=1 Tax=Cellulophaga baltica TaxID=76594 RepID=A0A1G7F5H4_9FLAO|nr:MULTISPECIES: peptidoglycan DD-metalloendopeptidase family protein [Cellulophaga]AIY12394.1 peptidase M23 [Cellulophaga baltica NN016038]KGK31096.1 peptidase M23 [Cellulophaga sp. E6(2014)]MCR1025547.1 peptidoglycan DD-metalloendopeptidase family protein [Cellulophaga baltica]SDE71157.1 Murein DD-endopeptidase MepM and murein hydrolase activator NlpD, contain LysM domain [Cellulophaga baltica]